MFSTNNLLIVVIGLKNTSDYQINLYKSKQTATTVTILIFVVVIYKLVSVNYE